MIANPSRRGALQLSLAAIAAGFTVPAVASTETNPDAELLQLCHRFAEKELDDWYRSVALDEDNDGDLDWETYRQIGNTPARTPEGCQAKALVYSAWFASAYAEIDQDDPNAVFLSLLLTDLVAPVRNPIVYRLAEKYGPLPPDYTPEGIWLGPSLEEQAALEAERAAHKDEMERKRDIRTMSRAELEESASWFRLQRKLVDIDLALIAERLAGSVA